jgi:putative transposase
VLDWFSRRVLSWRLSITMEAAFCIERLEDALALHGKPNIFNTDQDSQFTGSAFTGVLANNDIAISMDGKGAWRDNVFVERLWRSVKYEEVYLPAYDSVGEARASIGRYLTFTTVGGHTRALTAPHPIKLTSRRCLFAWQRNPGRCSNYRRGDFAQTIGTTSVLLILKARRLLAADTIITEQLLEIRDSLNQPLFQRRARLPGQQFLCVRDIWSALPWIILR